MYVRVGVGVARRVRGDFCEALMIKIQSEG